MEFKRQQATAYHLLLGLRTAVREDFAVSLTEPVYGENSRLAGDLVIDRRDDLGGIELLRLHTTLCSHDTL